MSILISDPIDILLDSDGDIDFTNGGEFSVGVAAVAQGIRIAVLLVRGEWFLNLDAGVAWYENDSVIASQAILGQAFDELKVLAAMREAIEDVPGVASVATLTVEFNGATRAMSVAWRVLTEFGDTIADSIEQGA